MKKLFVSCPIKGRTFENVCTSIKKMHQIAEIVFDEELEVINSAWANELKESNISDLARHIADMGKADYFIGIEFEDHWKTCCIESYVAQKYGIKSVYVNPRDLMPDIYEVKNTELADEWL